MLNDSQCNTFLAPWFQSLNALICAVVVFSSGISGASSRSPSMYSQYPFPIMICHSEFPRREFVFIKFFCNYLASIFRSHLSFNFRALAVIKLSKQLWFRSSNREIFSYQYYSSLRATMLRYHVTKALQLCLVEQRTHDVQDHLGFKREGRGKETHLYTSPKTFCFIT